MIVAIMTTALSGTAWAETVTFNFSELAKANGWENGVAYTSVEMSPITLSAAGGGNNGKYYTSDNSWRMYNGGTVNVTAADGYEVTAVSSTPSQTFTISNGSASLSCSATIKFTAITVTYSTAGSSTPTYAVTYDANGGSGTMTDSNSPYEENDEVTLLTNSFAAPEDMIWDSWEVKDASDNEITVTSGKFIMPASNVTVTAQWVADPNAPQYEWVETGLSDLTSTDIFVIVGTNSGTFAMTNDNGTGSAPTASSVTVTNGKITSIVANNMKWNISGDATNGYTFYPNGDNTTWLYCNTTANSSSNNNMRVGSGDRKVFELNSNNYLVTKDTYTARYISVYNGQDWRGYTSSSTTVKFYKRQVVSNDPAIYADNVNIAYDATSGEITYTLENATGNVSASVPSGSWITLGTVTSTTVPFTCVANPNTTARTETVTLTYGSVTKEVTVTQAAAPVAYTTIPDMFAGATSTETGAYVTFNNWVVSGVSTNGKNVFVTDNNGNGFVIYSSSDQSLTYAVGDILSGTAVSCNLVLYNGFAEIKNLDAEDLTITSGGTVSTSSIAMASLAGVNTGAVVSYENLTCSINDSKYYLSDGITTLQVYNALYAFEALEAGKTYNITGVYQQFNSTKEILPRTAADIEEVQVQHEAYTLTIANSANVTITANYGEEVLQNGENADVEDGTEITFVLSVDEGYVLESLTIAGSGGQTVTPTQANGVYTFTMPAYDVTISATATEGQVIPTTNTYELVTDASTLAAGDVIIFAYGSGSNAVAMSKTQNENNRGAVSVTESSNRIEGGSDIQQVTLEGDATGWYFNVGNGYLYAASSSKNWLRTESEKDNNNNAKATIELGSESYATITFQGTNARNLLKYNNNDNIFSCYASGQKSVRIYRLVDTPTPETRTLNTQGYATFASTSAVNFDNTGITAWAVTAVSGSTITFAQVTGNIAAETGLLLKGSAGAPISPETVTSGNTPAVNLLKGKTSTTDVAEGEYYGLKGAEFVKVNEGTVPAGRALLLATDVEGTGTGEGVKALTFVFEDDATGISTVESFTEEGAIYNLAGQRIQKMQKGINIVNGKKVLK